METQHALLIAAYKAAILEGHICLELLELTDLPMAEAVENDLAEDAFRLANFAADLASPYGRNHIRATRATTAAPLHLIDK